MELTNPEFIILVVPCNNEYPPVMARPSLTMRAKILSREESLSSFFLLKTYYLGQQRRPLFIFWPRNASEMRIKTTSVASENVRSFLWLEQFCTTYRYLIFSRKSLRISACRHGLLYTKHKTFFLWMIIFPFFKKKDV